MINALLSSIQYDGIMQVGEVKNKFLVEKLIIFSVKPALHISVPSIYSPWNPSQNH